MDIIKKKNKGISIFIRIRLKAPDECPQDNLQELMDCINKRRGKLFNAVKFIYDKSPILTKINYEIDEIKKQIELVEKEKAASSAAFVKGKVLLKEPIYLNKKSNWNI